MCGIIGIVAPTASQEWKFHILQRLLSESQTRGRDATGIAFLQKNGKALILKDGVEADKFIETSKFLKLKERIPQIVIGHTRSASRFKVNYRGSGTVIADAEDNKNNHPFYSSQSGLTLVHNGLMDDDFWRDSTGEEDGIMFPCESQTDSEIFLRVLETFHLRVGGELLENIEDTAFNVSGDYTLAILKDGKPDNLWLVRHSKPLSIAYIPSVHAIIFASEESIIKEALTEEERMFGFFIKENIPEYICHQAADDQAIKLSIIEDDSNPHGFTFDLIGTKLKCATNEYKYHVQMAELEEKEKKESNEENEEKSSTIVEELEPNSEMIHSTESVTPRGTIYR